MAADPSAKVSLLRDEELAYIGATAPYWHACVLGPVPVGQTERIHLQMDYIFVKTWDEAVAVITEHLIAFCELYNHPLDAREWDFVHIKIRNGN